VVKRAPVGKKKKEKALLSPVECKGCGVVFIPEDRRQHYHSEDCRERYYQRTYFAKTKVRKICANPDCGTEFVTSKPGRQDYCCPECRVGAQKKRREGVIASITAEQRTLLGDRFAALERGGFRCVYCGRGPRDGIVLDVEDDKKGGLQSVCNLCVEGRQLNAGPTRKDSNKEGSSGSR